MDRQWKNLFNFVAAVRNCDKCGQIMKDFEQFGAQALMYSVFCLKALFSQADEW